MTYDEMVAAAKALVEAINSSEYPGHAVFFEEDCTPGQPLPLAISIPGHNDDEPFSLALEGPL